METKIVLLVILLAVGALQGIIFGIVLWRTDTIHKIANRFLASILFFFSYRLVTEILHFFGLGRYDTWYYFLLEYNWIYGALIYFFILSYLNPGLKFKREQYIHFAPVIIEVIWSFFIKSQNFYWDGTRESLSWLGYWGYVVWMHYPTMYIVSGVLIIYYSYRAEKILKEPPTVIGYVLIEENVQWLKRIIKALRIFCYIFTATVLIEFLFFDYAFGFFGYPIFIIMAVITYWLGLEGFNRRNIVAFKKVDQPSEKDLTQYREIATRLTTLMEEKKLYKNQELTLAQLADEASTKPYLVSKTLAVIFKTKFSDYINQLRFEELKWLLNDPDNSKYTLLSLAFEAGFNSKASFNRTVVKLTGKSPKYLKSQ